MTNEENKAELKKLKIRELKEELKKLKIKELRGLIKILGIRKQYKNDLMGLTINIFS